MHLATYCTCTTIVTHFSTEARGRLPSDPPTAYRQSDMTATPTPNRLLAIAGTRDHWLVAGLYLQGRGAKEACKACEWGRPIAKLYVFCTGVCVYIYILESSSLHMIRLIAHEPKHPF